MSTLVYQLIKKQYSRELKSYIIAISILTVSTIADVSACYGGCSEADSDVLGRIKQAMSFFPAVVHTIYKPIHRGKLLKGYIEERAIEIAHYITEQNATVRQAAKAFGVSKSTVHKDVTERLIQINPILAHQARTVLDTNKSERHIRGGMATKEKYQHRHDM